MLSYVERLAYKRVAKAASIIAGSNRAKRGIA